MLRFKTKFTAYEKWYLIIAIALASVFAVLFPEEDVNGVNGWLIQSILLIYTCLNVVCELLISKQNKTNFLVSVFIEISEITMYLLLGYRFATMATALLFWLPIDIASFFVWKENADQKDKEKTKVRELQGWQKIAVIFGIIVWTVIVGSLIVHYTNALAETTTIFDDKERQIAIIVCYLDAMISALDICNGTFILLRYKEQWIAWYLEVILDGICVILSGQYILLVLTAAYLVNTSYGYIKWGEYIRNNKS